VQKFDALIFQWIAERGRQAESLLTPPIEEAVSTRCVVYYDIRGYYFKKRTAAPLAGFCSLIEAYEALRIALQSGQGILSLFEILAHSSRQRGSHIQCQCKTQGN
jgi:hypothetical protein